MDTPQHCVSVYCSALSECLFLEGSNQNMFEQQMIRFRIPGQHRQCKILVSAKKLKQDSEASILQYLDADRSIRGKDGAKQHKDQLLALQTSYTSVSVSVRVRLVWTYLDIALMRFKTFLGI